MSIATEIARIQGEKSRIAIKLTDMGLVESTADLETLADAIEDMPNKGAVTATVRQGESYTIPAGYHNGSGTVTGLDNPEADASKYMLQSKSITPTKSPHSVTPDQGYYGLSSVTVAAIPAAYQNVTQVDAADYDVLAGKKIVAKDGTVLVGTMVNNGEWGAVLDLNQPQVQIPRGFHDGEGVVTISPENAREVTPNKDTQSIAPATGRVLSVVTVKPIPDKYQDVTGVTATAANVLKGTKIVTADGTLTDGQMPNIGTVNVVLDASYSVELGGSAAGYLNSEFTIPKGYHDGNGKVKIIVEEKEVTPTELPQTVVGTPAVATEPAKVLGAVKVKPIPSQYKDLTNQLLTPSQVLKGGRYIDKTTGELTYGTIENLGEVRGTINTYSQTEFHLSSGGHFDEIYVTLDNSDLISELQKI